MVQYVKQLEEQNKQLLDDLAKPHLLNASPGVQLTESESVSVLVKLNQEQAAEIAALRAALELGKYLLTIPAVQDASRQIDAAGQNNPVVDFDFAADEALKGATK